MTLYHFGNCLALVYVPYHLTYKYSGLIYQNVEKYLPKWGGQFPNHWYIIRSEYGAFWKCIQAGGIYIITQLCKMLLLATFFPTAETNIHGHVDIFGEWLKGTVELADLVGLYAVLSNIPGKGHAKLLTAGLGWAGAEAALTRFVPLWIGARGAEFHWRYIQESLESNINLAAEAALTRFVPLWIGARGAEFHWHYIQESLESNINLAHHIATVALVWLWSRHDLSKAAVPIVTAMLLLSSYKPLLLQLILPAAICPWIALLIKAGYTLLLAFPTLKIYAGLAESIGIY